jgi:hypothetical protein
VRQEQQQATAFCWVRWMRATSRLYSKSDARLEWHHWGYALMYNAHIPFSFLTWNQRIFSFESFSNPTSKIYKISKSNKYL